jgi:hypothetical protein
LPEKLRFVIPEDGDAETAFPINETSYPSADPESFLLIVRTSHVVTAVHTATIQRGCISLERRVAEDTTEFPAYSRLLIALSPTRGAAPLCLQRGIPTLGTFVTTRFLSHRSSDEGVVERPDHFCLAPHVAMGVGLYLQLRSPYSSRQTGTVQLKRLACSL